MNPSFREYLFPIDKTASYNDCTWMFCFLLKIANGETANLTPGPRFTAAPFKEAKFRTSLTAFQIETVLRAIHIPCLLSDYKTSTLAMFICLLHPLHSTSSFCPSLQPCPVALAFIPLFGQIGCIVMQTFAIC